MSRFILLTVFLLTGCFGGLRSEYGAKHQEGERLSTTCAVVTSFASELRSAPGLHEPDAFVGYYDYGPGMPRGPVFLIAPVPVESLVSVGALLQSADPKKRPFWLEAKLRSGDLASGDAFEAWVPAKQRSPSPRSTIIDREAVLVRGHLHSACGKRYLVAVQGSPFLDTEREWPIISKKYDLFLSHIEWPR